MSKPRKTEAEIRAAIQDALTELSAEGKPFNLYQLSGRAGIANSLLFDKKYADLKKQAREVIDQLGGKKKVNQPVEDPTYTALQEELEATRQRNAELRQQLAEMQEQLQSKPGVEAVEVFRPTTWLEGQAQAWKDAIADYEQELEVIQSDLESARSNLAAVERLLELTEVPEAVVTMEAINAALGNYPNGKATTADLES